MRKLRSPRKCKAPGCGNMATGYHWCDAHRHEALSASNQRSREKHERRSAKRAPVKIPRPQRKLVNRQDLLKAVAAGDLLRQQPHQFVRTINSILARKLALVGVR